MEPLIQKTKSFFAWLQSQKPVYATARARGGSFDIRLAFGESHKDDRRLHLELAKPGFPSVRPPTRVKKEQLQKILNHVEGQSITYTIDGYFEVPISDLPSVIRISTQEITVGDVSIQMESGRLAVSGAPIHKVEWWWGPEGMALLDLVANRKGVIDQKYLMDALDLVDSTLPALLQGEKAT